MTEMFKPTPETPDEFSKNLNQALDQLGWPQRGRIATLARVMGGLAPASVRKWLNGEGLPEVKRLGELSRLTNKSVEWLLTGNSDSPKDHIRAQSNNYLQEHSPRKIIQLHALRLDGPKPDVELIGLCNDGSIWQKSGIHRGAEWKEIEGIPEPDIETAPEFD